MRKIMIALLVSLTPLASQASPNQVTCMAQAIYHESRGQSKQCQSMVADVIINRIEHPRYPSTVCGVVHQRGQFSWVGKGYRISDKKSYAEAQVIANLKYREMQTGTHRDMTHNSHYFTTGKRLGKVKTRCGGHVFMGGA